MYSFVFVRVSRFMIGSNQANINEGLANIKEKFIKKSNSSCAFSSFFLRQVVFAHLLPCQPGILPCERSWPAHHPEWIVYRCFTGSDNHYIIPWRRLPTVSLVLLPCGVIEGYLNSTTARATLRGVFNAVCCIICCKKALFSYLCSTMSRG